MMITVISLTVKIPRTKWTLPKSIHLYLTRSCNQSLNIYQSISTAYKNNFFLLLMMFSHRTNLGLFTWYIDIQNSLILPLGFFLIIIIIKHKSAWKLLNVECMSTYLFIISWLHASLFFFLSFFLFNFFYLFIFFLLFFFPIKFSLLFRNNFLLFTQKVKL